MDIKMEAAGSPTATLGTITLLVAFVVAAYAATGGILGNVTRKRGWVISSVYALYGFFALMGLASALLLYAFVSHDYAIKYVTQYSDTSMPLAYKITAYWGGLDGSLMFWVTVLAGFSTVAVRMNARRHEDMIGFVVGVVMLVQLFFLAVLIFHKNPFATWLTAPPFDGKGLNPLLQNYWMVIHPPSLYIGFVAATIPFAFGIAALASGRLDDKWLSSVRLWMFVCWFFLSFGLILGGRWAYEELGWGGYWAWDPVENAGLIPWFTATAFLHSVMIQEQRGMMKGWNSVLVILTFLLTIFGTFMTRSGVVQSVHAFGEDNALALVFILFMCVISVVSFGLLFYRLPQLRGANRFESLLSREFAFLLNNWILVGCAFFVLFATMFPTFSEALAGERKTVGPPFFNTWMVPLGIVVVLLSGIAPLLAWRKTTTDRLVSQMLFPFAFGIASLVLCTAFVMWQFPLRAVNNLTSPTLGAKVWELLQDRAARWSLVNFVIIGFTCGAIAQEFWRGAKVRQKQTEGSFWTSMIGIVFAKQRRYGGYLIHAGVCVMFFGFAGRAYETMDDRTVTAFGEKFNIGEHHFRLRSVREVVDDNKAAVYADLEMLNAKGEVTSLLHPAKYTYSKLPDQPTTEVDIDVQPFRDVYAVLTGIESSNDPKVMEEAKKLATTLRIPPDEIVAISAVNLRIYDNPLIPWVWLGFGFLAIGTAICLIPRGVISTVANGPKPPMGRMGEGALILLVAGAITVGSMHSAMAQAEHDDDRPRSMSNHAVAQGAAHLSRPDDPAFLAPFRKRVEDGLVAKGLTPGTEAFGQAVSKELDPVIALAKRTTADLVCMCGGCTRETVYECKCSFAADERKTILAMLSTFDLLNPAQREAAYATVIKTYEAKYQGEHVLIVPEDKGFNRLAWALPLFVLGGAAIVLMAVGKKWVRRNAELAQAERTAMANRMNEQGGENKRHQDLVDKLDDELAQED